MWHLYVIEVDTANTTPREHRCSRLRKANIGVNVHYIPIHTQPHHRRLALKAGDFPHAEHYYAHAICRCRSITDEQQGSGRWPVLRGSPWGH